MSSEKKLAKVSWARNKTGFINWIAPGMLWPERALVAFASGLWDMTSLYSDRKGDRGGSQTYTIQARKVYGLWYSSSYNSFRLSFPSWQSTVVSGMQLRPACFWWKCHFIVKNRYKWIIQNIARRWRQRFPIFLVELEYHHGGSVYILSLSTNQAILRCVQMIGTAD